MVDASEIVHPAQHAQVLVQHRRLAKEIQHLVRSTVKEKFVDIIDVGKEWSERKSSMAITFRITGTTPLASWHQEGRARSSKVKS